MNENASDRGKNAHSAYIDELLKKDAFINIEPERMDAFRRFAMQIEGKSTAEIVVAFMNLMQTLPKGRAIEKAERDAILAAISESLPEADRLKLQAIAKMIGKNT